MLMLYFGMGLLIVVGGVWRYLESRKEVPCLFFVLILNITYLMSENEKIIASIVAACMIIFAGTAILYNNSDKNIKEIEEPQNSIYTDEIGSGSNRNESYFKQKGYQIFPQFNMAIKSPVILKDISRQTSHDFDLEYGGVENENNPARFAAYQLMIFKLPASYKALSNQSKEQFRKYILNRFSNLNGEFVKFSHEELDAYVAYSKIENYDSRCIYFLRDNYVFGLVVISNDRLTERFNKLTNDIQFYNKEKALQSGRQTEGHDSEYNQKEVPAIDSEQYNIYYKTGFGAFSIAYPKGWELIENPENNVSAIMMEEEQGNKFRNSLNIIVSNNARNLDAALTDRSEYEMKEVFPDYTVLSKSITKLTDRNCLELLTSCTMYGYPVMQNQYIFKKGDNIMYTLTFTISKGEYMQKSNMIKEIINSVNFN